MKLKTTKFGGSKFSAVFLIILVFNLFFMRPAAFGQKFTAYSLFFSVIVLGVYVMLKNKKYFLIDEGIYRDSSRLFALVGAYLVYVGVISVIFGKSNLDLVIKEIFTAILVVSTYSFFLLNKNNNKFFFSFFSSIISLIGYSAIVTLILAFFVNIDALQISAINTKGYEDNSETIISTGGIYFPFTMLYGQFTSGEIILLRVAGFFREAGIYQAICCSCLAYEFFTRRSKLIMFGLVAGVVTSFSTAGAFTLIMTVCLIFLYQARKSRLALISFFFMVVVAYPIVYYMPYIGLAEKGSTHSTTISDRYIAAIEGVEEVASNPVGNGIFRNTKINSGINLIASMGSIGLMGFFLQFMIVSGWRFRFKGAWSKRIIACSPLLITALFSQPIAGAPMIYVLTMMDFD